MIYYFGDSTITGVDGAQQSLGWAIPMTQYLGFASVNLGVAGQSIGQLIVGSGNPTWINPGWPHAILSLANRVSSMQAGDVVVIECGINDANPAAVASGLDTAIQTVKAKGLLCALQTPVRPSNSRFDEVSEKTAVIRAKARQYGCPLIDVFWGTTLNQPYGIHPDQGGYQKMGQFCGKRLGEIFNPDLNKHKRAAEAACL